MEISYRPAKKEDVPQLVALFNAQYPRKKDETQVLWQYFGSFYPTVCYCAFSESTLVGAFTVQKRLLTDGTVIGHLIDLMVAPEWRNQGIFRALGVKAIEHFPDLEVVTVLPNRSGKVASEKAFGLRTLAKIDDLIIQKLSSIGQTTNVPPGEKMVRYQGGPEYEKWRYDENPRYRYERIRLPDGSYVVAKLFTDPTTGEQFWDIVNYQLAGQGTEMRKLFALTVETLSKRGQVRISTWALPHTPLHKVLTGLDAQPLARERYFCVKVLNPKREYLYDITRWELVPADAEIY